MNKPSQQQNQQQTNPPTREQILASGLRELVRPCSHALHAYTDPALLYLLQRRPAVAFRLMNTALQEAERMLSNLEQLQKLLPSRSLNRLAELEQEATRSRSSLSCTTTRPPSSTTPSQTSSSSSTRSSSTRKSRGTVPASSATTTHRSPISSRSPTPHPSARRAATAAGPSQSELEHGPTSSPKSNAERKQSESEQLRKRAAMLRRDRDSLQVCVRAIVAHVSRTETKRVAAWD